MVMNSSGQIGIGTTNPSGIFHLVSPSSPVLYFDGNGLTSSGGPSIIMRGLGSVAGSQSQFTIQTFYAATTPGGYTNITTQTYPAGGYNNLNIYSSNLYVSGNLGIGKIPTCPLDVNGTIKCPTMYANAITCYDGTIQTNYAQGSNAPSSGQAYFYNPTNSAGQCASVGIALAGSTAANCYYSYNISGVAGYSHGITGASQNLVFKASSDFTTGTLFTMDRSGNFTATASVVANSDRRIKTDIEVIPNALEKLKKISGYTFNRTDVTLPRQVGVIAQEIKEVLPEAVHEDDKGILSVAYGNLTALLIEALKEEIKKREDLEKKLLKPTWFETLKKIFL